MPERAPSPFRRRAVAAASVVALAATALFVADRLTDTPATPVPACVDGKPVEPLSLRNDTVFPYKEDGGLKLDADYSAYGYSLDSNLIQDILTPGTTPEEAEMLKYLKTSYARMQADPTINDSPNEQFGVTVNLGNDAGRSAEPKLERTGAQLASAVSHVLRLPVMYNPHPVYDAFDPGLGRVDVAATSLPGVLAAASPESCAV